MSLRQLIVTRRLSRPVALNKTDLTIFPDCCWIKCKPEVGLSFSSLPADGVMAIQPFGAEASHAQTRPYATTQG